MNTIRGWGDRERIMKEEHKLPNDGSENIEPDDKKESGAEKKSCKEKEPLLRNLSAPEASYNLTGETTNSKSQTERATMAEGGVAWSKQRLRQTWSLSFNNRRGHALS